MFEFFAAGEPVTPAVVQEVGYVQDVGRVARFRLAVNQAIPETRATPVLLVAISSVEVETGRGTAAPVRLTLEAGQAHFFADGIAGLTNTGQIEARFTLIDVPQTDQN